MAIKLIVDSGSTKTIWCLLDKKNKKTFHTQGISPYFLSQEQIHQLIVNELKPDKKNIYPDEVYYYGTGCSGSKNVKTIKNVLNKIFKNATIEVNSDLLGAARALCGKEKGMACILGTGSNSCYFNGKKIVKNSPSLGFIVGDEGSGTYLGRKVVQYFLYNTFEGELMDKFTKQFNLTANEILHAIYKQPFPNRFLASFTMFLVENRGHYMVENIIEDGLNDFFFTHLYKYKESWRMPINFVGSVAYAFKDILKEMCNVYELQLGKILKDPMEGLIKYHN